MIDKIQTIGLGAKGLVFSIVGTLTALAAFDMGGQTAGKSATIDFLQKQPFGKFILYALSAGILAYALWRLYTAFFDPKDKGSDSSGVAKRFGYLCSALIYLLFSITIFVTTMGSSGGGGGKQYYLAQLMEKSYGPIIFCLVGVIIIGVGFYQMYKGYSGKFLDDINAGQSSQRDILKKTGKYGHMARGVVYGIIGYFSISAGYLQNPEMVRSIKGAFSFLQRQPWGSYLMGILAIGMLGYGIFMFFMAKHSSVRT